MHIFNVTARTMLTFRLIAKTAEGVNNTNLIQACHPLLSIPRKISKFENDVILSRIIFSFSKRQMHIFNMSALIMQSLRKFIIQTFLKGTDRWMDRQTDGGKT